MGEGTAGAWADSGRAFLPAESPGDGRSRARARDRPGGARRGERRASASREPQYLLAFRTRRSGPKTRYPRRRSGGARCR